MVSKPLRSGFSRIGAVKTVDRRIVMNRFQFPVAAVVCAACVVIHAQAGLAGKWEGTTESGRPVVLDMKVKGRQLAGTITVGKQSADITDGKVEENTFSFKATIEDRTPTFSGRLVGEVIELTVEGVANPLSLKRVK
jgi:hypothetical protein